jgi:two-component system LytT family sensor kinase
MKKWIVVLLHVGYWLLYLMLIALITAFIFSALKQTIPRDEILANALTFVASFALLPAVIGFYLFYTVLFPLFLVKRKLWSLLVSAVLIAMFCGVIGCAVLSCIYRHAVFNITSASFLPVFITVSINGLLNGLMALVIRGFITWYADIKWKEALSRKNQEMEMALIKSQLDPHFLFNTINNIDILIEEDSAKASSFLNKLSDIMRFMLYETKTATIPLSKELSYIEKYIDLQKIRTANLNYIDYSVAGNPLDREIAPMLFIPFIENAFKHAGQKKAGNAITIKLRINEKDIVFYCENSYVISNLTVENGGLGNEMILKRIALLYPDRYTLNIENKDQLYKVTLIIREK